MSNVIFDLFDLKTDQADADVIDEALRTNVKVAGTNLWVLIFAILVASVGLNVNSTAVIIGAMLISPLMGPIVGFGYGLGINDIQLMKLALRNLAIFTFISVVASALYFAFSPLNTAQSELLARTSPTIWDVLIAFFGGSAGIIATTRKSMSNVVPGVAIATALMPPVCTVGFGIAQGNWTFVGGALFLYLINSVFIALATWMFVKILHLPVRHYLDEKTEKRTNILIGLTVVCMISPSGVLAYNLVQQNKFTQSVNQFINSSYRDTNYILLGHETHPQLQEVILTVGGSQNPEAMKKELETQLQQQGFKKAHVIVRYSGSNQLDLGSLKTQLTQDLYNNMAQQVEELSNQNAQLKQKLTSSSQISSNDKKLFAELTVQYPLITQVSISRGERFVTTTTKPTSVITNTSVNNTSETPSNQADTNASSVTSEQALILLMIESSAPLSEDDKKRILDWLDVKYEGKFVEVRFEVT